MEGIVYHEKDARGLHYTMYNTTINNKNSYIQVVNGILQANPSVIRTKDQFIELLIHETSRIFLDRLIDEPDRATFNRILLDQIHDFLKTKWSKDRLLTNKGVFGDFIEVNVIKEKRVYRCLRDQRKLLDIIEVITR